MTTDELELIRKKQSEVVSEIKRLKKSKEKILELQQDPKVKEYFKLMQFINNVDEEKLIKNFYSGINKIACYTKESNNILYDYGNVIIITYENNVIGDYEESLMHVYRDLETMDYYCEMFDDRIDLMPPEWRLGSCSIGYFSGREYEKLRKYLLEQIITRSQEEVVEELLKNNKKLIKVRGGSFCYENK